MYYRWIESNEILVLRNAGLGCAEIARPGIIVAAVAAGFCAVNSLGLLAPSWRAVEDVRYQALAHVGLDALEPGYQQQIVPGVSIVFARRARDETLEDILLLDRRKQHKAIDIWAKRGGLAQEPQNRVLWLEDGVYLVRRDEKSEQVAFKTFAFPLDVSVFGDQTPRIRGLYEQAVPRLLKPPERIRSDPLKFAEWQTEGHRRLINPLLCCGSVVLVLGLMVPGRQNRRLAGRLRFAVAAILALATNTVPNALFEVAVHHLELLPFFYLLPTVPGIGGVLLLLAGDGRGPHLPRRLRQWRWPPMPAPLVEKAA
jgi:lipopolysaccharide export LptBFGC system permease protein LptF